MIQKAIIVSQSETEPNKYKVRIPVLHGLPTTPDHTRDENLPYAPVCGIYGISPFLDKGDVVFVAFENNEFDTPVILGQLLVEKRVANIEDKNSTQSRAEITCHSIDISGDAWSDSFVKLPSNTSIGNISATEITTLQNIKSNIQAQIDDLLNQLDLIKNQLDNL